nr:reverse transcriptase domain-containing protein [Tanacetum cinerariifolium]
MSTKEYERRHRSRRSRSPRPSVFPRIRCDRSRLTRQNSREKEGGVFKRLGNRGRSVSAHSDGHNQRSYLRHTKALSESEDSGGGHWKSRSKKKKSSREEDDLSQPWLFEEIDPFTPRIRYFDFPKTRMPSHIKTYDGSEDPEDHLKIFQAAAKTKRWAMPTWWHSTDECIHLKKQIEEMLKAGKLSHLIKELKQNSEKEQPKAAKKGESSGKDKALAILMEGTEGPMIIEAEIGGHRIHSMYVDGGSASEILENITIGKDWRRRILRFSLDEFHGGKVTISVQRNYWKTKNQETASSSVNSSQNAEAPDRRRSNYPKKQQPADMIGIPRHIAKHHLNVREGCSPVRQKKRGQAADRNQAIQEEVRKFMEARIMKEVYYHDWLSNPSERGVQANETANRRASHADRTNGKGGTYRLFGGSQRNKEDSLDTLMEAEEALLKPWILFMDGSSCTDGSKVGMILTNPEGMEFTYDLRFRFDATNNEAKYKALIPGLRIAKQ